MKHAWRTIAGLLAVGALATGGSVAFADGGGGHGGNAHGKGAGQGGNATFAPTMFTMDPAAQSPEGVAFDKRSGRFFVSRTGTGAIWVGTLGSLTLTELIPGVVSAPVPKGLPLATGLKVRKNLLYVAGASKGDIRVYDLADPAKPPVVFPTGGGFVNDLDVTSNGDVFATDSTKSVIYKVDAAAVTAGGGAVQPIDVSSKITSDPADFNLNGIVARSDHELIVVQSNTGRLFRVRLGDDGKNDDHKPVAAPAGPLTPTVEAIDLGADNVKGGDGLLEDRGRLLVVQGAPTNAIAVVKLRRHRTRGTVESRVTNASFTTPTLVGPSTIARAGNMLLVVNANFAAATTASNFAVAGVPREAVRRGGGGHGGGG